MAKVSKGRLAGLNFEYLFFPTLNLGLDMGEIILFEGEGGQDIKED